MQTHACACGSGCLYICLRLESCEGGFKSASLVCLLHNIVCRTFSYTYAELHAHTPLLRVAEYHLCMLPACKTVFVPLFYNVSLQVFATLMCWVMCVRLSFTDAAAESVAAVSESSVFCFWQCMCPWNTVSQCLILCVLHSGCCFCVKWNHKIFCCMCLNGLHSMLVSILIMCFFISSFVFCNFHCMDVLKCVFTLPRHLEWFTLCWAPFGM